MKKTFALLLAALMLLVVVGCTPKEVKPTPTPDTDVIKPDDVTKPDDMPKPDDNGQNIETYALTLAKYFQESVGETTELINNSHLYEFLVNSVYALCKDNVISLEDVSEKEWYPEFLIPNDYMKKAAALLLGIESDLPEKYYFDPEFEYDADANAFRYAPTDFSPPMLNTVCNGVTHNDNGVLTVTVEITNVDGNDARTMIYIFKTVTDDDWGEVYRLVYIMTGGEEISVPILNLEKFVTLFTGYMNDNYKQGDELKDNVLYALARLGIYANMQDIPTFEIEKNEDELQGTTVAIKRSELERLAYMMLGTHTDVTEFNGAMANSADRYDPETDTYTFCLGRDYWNEDSCIFVYDSVEITEQDGLIEFNVTIIKYGEAKEVYGLKYTLETVEEGGILYYRILSIEKYPASLPPRSIKPIKSPTFENYFAHLGMSGHIIEYSIRNGAILSYDNVVDFCSTLRFYTEENNLLADFGYTEKIVGKNGEEQEYYIMSKDDVEKIASALLGTVEIKYESDALHEYDADGERWLFPTNTSITYPMYEYSSDMADYNDGMTIHVNLTNKTDKDDVGKYAISYKKLPYKSGVYLFNGIEVIEGNKQIILTQNLIN